MPDVEMWGMSFVTPGPAKDIFTCKSTSKERLMMLPMADMAPLRSTPKSIPKGLPAGCPKLSVASIFKLVPIAACRPQL
jgi:hypothetical protein